MATRFIDITSELPLPPDLTNLRSLRIREAFSRLCALNTPGISASDGTQALCAKYEKQLVAHAQRRAEQRGIRWRGPSARILREAALTLGTGR